MKRFIALVFAASLCGPSPSQRAQDLETPFRVATADSKLIDVDVGHAAPLLVDFDRDGLVDLLVGQFGEGKLRIYRNTGSKTAPAFKDFTLFMAGGVVGKVPTA